MALKRNRAKSSTLVMAFGGFDVLHLGHLHLLESAKKLGDRLYVVVASDAILKKVKHHDAYFDEEERRKLVGSLKFVDKAIRGDRNNTLVPILKFKPDLIALGYDQPKKPEALLAELKEAGCKKMPRIVRISKYKTHKHKSTKVKKYFERFV